MPLPSLLTDSDFSPTELSALRIDGDVFSVGDGFVCADGIEDAAIRIRAIGPLLGSPRIAARETAGWIYGQGFDCPRPVQVVVPAGRSQSTEPLRGVRLREAVLTDDEVVELGGLLITSPLRTIVDLLRESGWIEADAERVSGLMLREGHSPARVADALSERRFQRERVRAMERLAELERLLPALGQPAETRYTS